MLFLIRAAGRRQASRPAARPPVETPAPRLPPHQRRAVACCRGLWLLWVRELGGSASAYLRPLPMLAQTALQRRRDSAM